MTLSNRMLTALPTLNATGLQGGKLTFTNGGANAQKGQEGPLIAVS